MAYSQTKLVFSIGGCTQTIENAGVHNVSLFTFVPTLISLYVLGDLTSISIFGTTIVTVHTYEKAVEMLEKKSLIYSCRARLQMLHLGGFENHVAFLPYGGKLQECRRMIRSEINPVNTPNHYAIHEATVRRFLRTLAKSPEQFYERIEWYVYGADPVLL